MYKFSYIITKSILPSYRHHFCFLAIVFLAAGLSYSQKVYHPRERTPLVDSWRWKHIAELDGKGFADFCESQNGTMWFGINNGLMHYDGFNWKTYLTKGTITIGKINEILVVDTNTIYIGSTNGLHTFSNKTHKWETIISNIGNYRPAINSVNLIGKNIVAACSDRGLITLSNGKGCFYTQANNIPVFDTLYPELNIIPICTDCKTDDFVFRDGIDYKGKALFFVQVKNHPPQVFEARYTLHDDSPLTFSPKLLNNPNYKDASFGMFTYSEIINQDELWLVSQSVTRGISMYRQSNWNNFNLSDLFHLRNHQSGIVQLKDSTIIVAGAGMLYALKNGNWKLYQKPEIPVPGSVYLRIEATKNGNLWVGGRSSEVYFHEYSDNRYKVYDDLIFQFERAPNERWFLSSDNKVVVNKDDTWQYYDQSDGIIEYPQRLISTADGSIWCAGSSSEVSAISVFNGQKWQHFLFDTLSWGIENRSVFEHPDGSVWFGSPSGSRQGEKMIDQQMGILIGKKVNNNYVWKHIWDGIVIDGFAIGRDSNIYFSDFFNTYTIKGDNKPEIFYGIQGKRSRLAVTPSGNIYFGTEDNGLFYYSIDTITNINVDNGLVSNTIIDIQPTSDTTLWVATEKDLSFFDGQTWIVNSLPKDFLFEKRGGSFKLDLHKNLWINNTSNRWTLRSYNRDFNYEPDNNFFTVRVNPDTTPPQVDFDFYKATIDKTGNTIISWKGHDYYNQTPVEQLLFAYKLDNNPWSTFTTNTNKVLFSLQSGHHHIQIKAKDQFGNISKNSPEIKFIVEYPIWQQAWFIILIGSFLLLVTFLILRIIAKNKSLKQLNTSLTNTFHQLELQAKEIQWKNANLEESKTETQQLNEELKTANESLFSQNEELGRTIDVLKKAQSQLVQSEKLASVGILTAGIAHELNNPLNFILGGKTAIEHYIEDNLPEHVPELKPLFDSINTGVDRSTDLIKSLNRFSRTSDHLKELCQIHEILENCLIMLQHELKNRIEVSTNYTNDPFILLGNEGKLHQVFLNIISNAQQAIESKGEIHIITQMVKDQLEVLIEDSGKGIDSKNLKKITEPFFTTKDPGKGTGLGLSIAYQIIKEHNGEINFTSTPGKGTTVIISLPVKIP